MWDKNQLNILEHPVVDPQIYGQFILHKNVREIQWSLLNRWMLLEC